MENNFFLYLCYWYTTAESWRRNSITTGAFLALTSELKFISQSISKQSDFWVKPPFFSSLLFLFLQHSQAASLELLVPGRGARAGWDGEETGQEGTECLTTVIKEHK